MQIRFTQEDVDALSTNLPQITQITPSVDKQSSVQYDTRVFTFTATGNNPNVYAIRSLKLAQGRFYNMEVAEAAGLRDVDVSDLELEPLILPVPITVSVVVLGAWEIALAGEDVARPPEP